MRLPSSITDWDGAVLRKGNMIFRFSLKVYTNALIPSLRGERVDVLDFSCAASYKGRDLVTSPKYSQSIDVEHMLANPDIFSKQVGYVSVRLMEHVVNSDEYKDLVRYEEARERAHHLDNLFEPATMEGRKRGRL